MSRQLDLFRHVADAYANTPEGSLDNSSLYERVRDLACLDDSAINRAVPVGRSGRPRSIVKRKIRWYQQTLKRLGLLERDPAERARWRLTPEGRSRLTRSPSTMMMIAFSTDLGLAIWGDCHDVFSRLDVPITLCLTSPPYPLRRPRAYGNPPESEYVDFICRAMEPIVKNLRPGGSIVLNVSNDIFEPGRPSRSLYRERLVLALCERLGLSKMDEVVWHNMSKPPGPVQWASVSRVQLNTAWEPFYWFTNDPTRVLADNRRVLEPHSLRQIRLMESGGERRHADYSDAAHRVRPGDFGRVTPGRIPRNVLSRGHTCSDQKQYKAMAKSLGLPVHGAPMPLPIARFFVEFLSAVDDLVVDPFGGSLTTAKAAEEASRRWVTTETILEYLRGGAERFSCYDGYSAPLV